jgi:SNF2 family DNA or RNA helicase
MRNYQIHGYKWLRTIAAYGFGGILADDMGLGKTLQMISVLLAAKLEGNAGCSLIVCPASLIYNWQEEFNRFAPEVDTLVIAGAQAERRKLIEDYASHDVLITSYDLLKRDIDLYDGLTFNYEVIDEAQYIKTHTTAASKAVKIINSSKRFALTGTPIENRLSELWSIFDYLMPGYLFEYETFKSEIENQVVKYKDEYATTRLKRMVSPFILRRLKGDVLKDLPAKLEEIRYAKLDGEQQKLYDGQVVHMKNMLEAQDESEFQKNKMRILAELTKIRQICCNPSLLFDDYKGESAKTQACLDLIESANEGGHKMLVFSQFTSMLSILERELDERKIAYYKITGETKKDKRIELVNQFNQDDTPVFLISLRAGGTGLNLTGADIVIHYDPWWNVAVQNQATDRAHRIGQTKTVSVYKLIVKNSIEEKIVKMQDDKKNLADEILSGDMGSIGKLSKEDLLELIG